MEQEIKRLQAALEEALAQRDFLAKILKEDFKCQFSNNGDDKINEILGMGGKREE